MSDVEGFVLAGGASSRMGFDKTRLLLGGTTLAARVAAAVGEAAVRVSLVSSKDGAGVFGLPVVRDVYEGCGALGGLHAALAACRGRWALVVSCDLPFVTGAMLSRLCSISREDFDAVVPTQPDGKPQPLCSIYDSRVCAPAAEGLIRSGDLRAGELSRRVRTLRVAFEELSVMRGSDYFFLNVNTPEEFERARLLVAENS